MGTAMPLPTIWPLLFNAPKRIEHTSCECSSTRNGRRPPDMRCKAPHHAGQACAPPAQAPKRGHVFAMCRPCRACKCLRHALSSRLSHAQAFAHLGYRIRRTLLSVRAAIAGDARLWAEAVDAVDFCLQASVSNAGDIRLWACATNAGDIGMWAQAANAGDIRLWARAANAKDI